MKEARMRILFDGERGFTAKPNAPVIYWMSRDMRSRDNWALHYAQKLAKAEGRPLLVLFCLVEEFLNAKSNQFDFMKLGLNEVASNLQSKNIPFILVTGEPKVAIPLFIERYGCAKMVCDFSPLKLPRRWKSDVIAKLNCPLVEVDAHNVIPAFFVSDKKEFAAYTIRPKIHRLLKEYLDPFPPLEKQDHEQLKQMPSSLPTFVPFSVSNPYPWIVPGESAAEKALDDFITKKLPRYHLDRNDPSLSGQSNLSPHLHFGTISAQTVVKVVMSADAPAAAKEDFIEEVLVRRELAENFCLYEPNYDSPLGFHEWAQKTHEKHAPDKRAYLYTYLQLENAETHDPLWNAAQKEMVFTGKMHGYMRMYWAKKILEWTKDVHQAMEFAIKLNDTYELDGRDPNGYTGIAWSIGGVHDRPWFERPIFGQVRYMNDNGLKKKFDTEAYLKLVEEKISPRLDFKRK